MFSKRKSIVNILKKIIFTLSIILSIVLLNTCSGENSQQVNAVQKTKNKETNVFRLFGSKETKNYVIASPLSGILMKDGIPLANTKIIRRLTWNGNEEGVVDEFVTDDKGAFSIPVHEKMLTLNTMTEFVASNMLYVSEENDNTLFWYSPKREEELYSDTGGLLNEMICEVNNEAERVNVTDSGVLTKCTWKNMP
jgi:PBP1b-binding outer membrane lipoprotein LpoB